MILFVRKRWGKEEFRDTKGAHKYHQDIDLRRKSPTNLSNWISTGSSRGMSKFGESQPLSMNCKEFIVSLCHRPSSCMGHQLRRRQMQKQERSGIASYRKPLELSSVHSQKILQDSKHLPYILCRVFICAKSTPQWLFPVWLNILIT